MILVSKNTRRHVSGSSRVTARPGSELTPPPLADVAAELTTPPSANVAPELPSIPGWAPFERAHGRSYGDPDSENVLIHGDNLEAMRRLGQSKLAGAFRCIYFDPPYNSGRRFAEYDDALEPREWRAMLRARLEAARPLLADEGSIFVEIDDTELGPLQVEMDDVFGRKQRVSTITVVRSAATGHKAINRGPVNVTDFLLVYAKERVRWRCNPILRERLDYDDAYSTWLENPNDAPKTWRFGPLVAHARRALGGEASRAAIERFAIDNAEHVVRFAQPRYEAVSRQARALIDRSRREPDRVLCLERTGRSDLVLRAGNRVLRLKDKVAVRDGRRVIVEPLTNVWDDVPFQGIAREGGARFVRNKKPERLIARILALATQPGDWVLDAFLGSGTTAAVAHKMGRRWVGIERGEQMNELCVPRLRRVVDGEDTGGMSRALGWAGGGGFHVCA
jgi:adenine-specific DNA-methyltransferase